MYLDSAATSQKPRVVIEAEKEWYEKYCANAHRGLYALAEDATQLYEKSRERVARFLGSDANNIVFTKGTTEAVSLVAHSWARENLKKGDCILLTQMEHHSNMVPWQLLAQEKDLKLRYWPIKKNGELDWIHVDELFRDVKLVSVAHVSNVLGVINPIKKIVQYAHKNGAVVFLDAAQCWSHAGECKNGG